MNEICHVKQIVVSEGIPGPGKHICKIGEKEFDRFFYVVKGTIYIDVKEGDRLVGTAGSIVYLTANVEYESHWDDSVEGHYIALNFVPLDETGKYIRLFDENMIIAIDNRAEIYKLFKEIKEFYIKSDNVSELMVQSLFYKITYEICKRDERKRLKEGIFEIYQAVVYLNDNYLLDIATEQLAEMCNLSPSTFRRIFRQAHGMSPLKYKNHLKMQSAREMLKSGYHTVSEVSDSVNCTDISHFNKLYKAEFGINPSEDIPKN